jgi:hypothetical protein
MAFEDNFQLPEMVVRPEDQDPLAPPPPITYGQEFNLDELKQKLAERLAQQIAEEEDQSSVRSNLRDVFNSDSEVGLASASEAPATPSSQPLRITVTPNRIINPSPTLDLVSDAPIDQQAQAPDLSGTVPDLTGVFGSVDATTVTPSAVQTLADTLDRTTRGVRQFARGAVSTAGAVPWTMAAGVAAIPGLIGEVSGFQRPPGVDAAVNWLLSRAENNRRFAENITGLGGDAAEPQNAVERVAKIIGENVTPIKGATIPATVIASTVNSLLGPAEARTLSVAEKAQAERTRAAKTQEIIETIGGPARVPKQELYTLGGIALTTIGMIFAPSIFRAFKTGSVPKLRSVEDAAPNTQAMSTNVDLARTYDDANAGALRIARRAGVDPVVMKEMEKTFGIQTRANAHALVDSAIMMGRMETPNFRFQAKTPLADLARAETPELAQYLHLRNTFDELMLKKTKPGANPGPPTLRGMTDQDVLRQIGALERANPEIKRLGAAYRDNLKSARTFATIGEYGTISRSQLRHLNSQRSNTTEFRGTTDDPRAKLGSPTDNLATHMHKILRERMENEAVGQYVDAMRKVEPSTFVRVSHKELHDNPNWKKNTVTMYRRGKPEYYTTDPLLADVLRMDPYYLGSMSGQGMYSLRRALETTTTGRLAPWFALTSATRNLHIGRYTTPSGMNPPTITGTLYAIPQQLLPQAAKAIANSLEHGSGQWLTKVFGQAGVNNMSTRLAGEFDKSIVAQMQAAGTTHASILENQTRAITKLQHAANLATGTGKAFINGYVNLLHAIHNAPMHNFASRNIKGTFVQRLRKRVPQNDIVDVAAEARHLTGSPKVSGAYYSGSFSGMGRPHPIRVEGTNRVTHKLTQTYGRAQQIANEMVPWHNVTMQGMKRIAESYVKNPVRFTGRMWAYSMMPAAASYYYARSLGPDPNGVDYVDYMMNRRSDYAKQMFMYVPIPGKPAEEGIEIPNFHEMAPAYRMMQVGLDHATRSSIFKESEDFKKAAFSFFSIAIEPPTPPVFNLAFATQGFVAPMGAFGGEAYKKRVDPYDQTGGLPASLEILARAVGGGVADVVGSGYAAFAQTPKGAGATQSFSNALEDMGKRVVSKTPYVRDVANIRAPATGNTPIVEAMFEKQKAIDNLVRFYQNYGLEGKGTIDTKSASVGGGNVANLLLGEGMPAESPGLDQPKPTNPLYLEYIKRFRDAVKKDDPEKGGMGYRSLWRRYGDVSKALQLTRNVNAGNYVTWQAQLEQRPEIKQYLDTYNIDHKNPNTVRNFFQQQRQTIMRQLLFAARGIEEQMSKEKGVPIKIEDLDPYGKGKIVGQDTGMLPDPILEMQMYPNP